MNIAVIHYEAEKNKIYIKRDSNTILITRKNGRGHNKSIFTIFKNDKAFIPEGELDDALGDNAVVHIS